MDPPCRTDRSRLPPRRRRARQERRGRGPPPRSPPVPHRPVVLPRSRLRSRGHRPRCWRHRATPQGRRRPRPPPRLLPAGAARPRRYGSRPPVFRQQDRQGHGRPATHRRRHRRRRSLRGLLHPRPARAARRRGRSLVPGDQHPFAVCLRRRCRLELRPQPGALFDSQRAPRRRHGLLPSLRQRDHAQVLRALVQQLYEHLTYMQPSLESMVTAGSRMVAGQATSMGW